MPQHHIAMTEQSCWVIRSTRVAIGGQRIISFYITPDTWSSSPGDATVFREEQAAQKHVELCRSSGTFDWLDGSKEYVDVVPLFGEFIKVVNARAHKD